MSKGNNPPRRRPGGPDPRRTGKPAAKSPARSTPARTPSERRQAQQKAGSATRLSAQQRLAAERKAAIEARANAERRRKLQMALIPVAVVVVVLVAFIAIRAIVGHGPKSGDKTTQADAAVITGVTSVPAATLNTVGAGTIKSVPKKLTGDALTADGKPRILFVGAEYCPYCAAERWAITVALSRFGTFSGLGQTASAPAPEAYPNTKTLSFHGATFTSQYLSFTGKELATNQVKAGSYTKLDSISDADLALFDKIGGKSYPFLDIGGKYMVGGASYDPQVLQGKTAAQIAAALKDPTSAIAKGVLGTANVITAAICAITKNAPAAVCTSAAVTAGTKKLNG